MTSIRVLPLLVCATVGCRHGSSAGVGDPGARPAAASLDRAVAPLLERYCFECHGHGARKGQVALDVAGDPALWQAVLDQLRTGSMPPQGRPQPTPDERVLLVRWIEAEPLRADCSTPDPGRVTARRLNRAEYDNTIRDLLGVDFGPADEFPVDTSALGFDNLAEALTVSPVLAEKYLAAARKVLDAALPAPARHPARRRRFPLDALEVGYNARPTGDGWVLLNSYEEDDVAASHEVPFEAEYLVRVRAHALQDPHAPAKYARGGRHTPVKLTFMLDDQIVEEVEVAATAAAPGEYQARARALPGRRRFRAVVRRIKDGLSAAEARKWKSGRQQKGSVAVAWLELEGPLAGADPPPAAEITRLLGAPPAAGEEREAARRIVAAFGRRAYRRPVEADELQRLMELVERAWSRGEAFEQGVRTALEAILVSPHFLFRQDTAEAGAPGPGGARRIGEHALAARLSYFLWSSTPDERLLAEADRGTLRRNLEAEVRRLLRDPRARALVDSLGGQWLQIRNLDLAAPDPRRFPGWDESLRVAMRRETELFFEAVVREDRSVLEFLEADWTFVNERLARHYGLAGVRGDELRRVSLHGTPRRGVLTHGSVLTLTSNPTRTSPVKRGVWVLDVLLAAPPPPPPPEVPDIVDAHELPGSLRARMEQHRANPVCASCHARMDPIGFGLENFDAIGAFREKDGEAPVDASGRLASGERFSGPLELIEVLSRHKRDQFLRALAVKTLTFALGRELRPQDRCALDAIARDVARAGHRFSALVLGVVRSAPFQMTRDDEPQALAGGPGPGGRP